MKPASSSAVFAIALLLAAGSAFYAQDAPAPPDVRAFAAQYVAAYNTHDLGRLLALYLPESRACIPPENKDVYAATASLNRHDTVLPGYLLSFTPVNEGNLTALASEMYLPVKPERELHIDYQYPNTNDGGQLVLWLVRRDGRWWSDFPCITAQGLKNFRDNAAGREQYKKIAAAIQEPLRSELVAMLRQHQIGEAEERYKKAVGCDMRTSMLVINALQEQMQ